MRNKKRDWWQSISRPNGKGEKRRVVGDVGTTAGAAVFQLHFPRDVLLVVKGIVEALGDGREVAVPGLFTGVLRS